MTKDLGSAAVFFAILLAGLIWIAALLDAFRVLTASLGAYAMIATGSGNWQLRDSEQIIKGNEALLGRKHLLVGMTRIRNEALILPDTLDYLADQVDAIVAYDDASTDDTVEHAAHASEGRADRRQSVLGEGRRCAQARRRAGIAGSCSTWRGQSCRTIGCSASILTSASPGTVRSFVAGLEADASDAVRVQLFDAYMTPEDREPYRPDLPLLHFRRFYGPEQRDILMLWRNRPEIFSPRVMGGRPAA